ncbi:MAG TPA: tetratricopeptide repeat protein [Thermoanaerobaculia bacterium]|nr:tetratricopeptide repeat protein [Thermoanaerobaculia bacterium]
MEAHLQGCTSCRQVVVEYREIVAVTSDPAAWHLIYGGTPLTADPERVRDFADRARRKEAETRDAAEAMRELRKLAPDGWWPWLGTRKQFQTAGMVAALLAEARKRVQSHPRESLQIVVTATAIAQMLKDGLDRPAMLGAATNARATALRYLGRYPEALAAVEEAATVLSPVGSAADEQARVEWNRATVLWALERYREARAALDGAKDWFRSIKDEVELARIGILEGSILYDEGDLTAALAIFTQVAHVLEAQPEQPDLAVVYANVAFCHLGLGNLTSARNFGERAMATYDHVELISERIRTRSMFAQLLIESGNIDEGLADLRTAAMEYEVAGMVAEAALVDLWRVEVLLRIDRWDEAASIARRLVVVYEQSGQRISHVQALAYLREAVEAMTATPELARYVRGFVGGEPEQPFRPPATPRPS